MDAFRKEVAWLSLLWFGAMIMSFGLLKFLFALPYQDTVPLIVLEFLVLVFGCIFAPTFFFSIGFIFVEEVIECRYWSSMWTWMMKHKKAKRIIYSIGVFLKKAAQKFVTGEYVGFKRLCLLVIVVGIIVYAVPYFHSEGLMSLPAISMFWSIVFIAKG